MVLRWRASLAVMLCVMPGGPFALIPEEIYKCYRADNYALFNRHNRQAVSMDQLIGLVERLEHAQGAQFMSPQRITATLLRRFRYDGIIDQNVNQEISTYLEPFTFIQPENAKFQMLQRLINLDNTNFPEDDFTLEEKCTMHWLLSHSVNETERDDENDFCGRASRRRRAPRRYGSRSRSRSGSSSSGSGGQVSGGFVGNVPDEQASNCPLEMGVVYSPYGPVAAGTLIAGMAAGLSEQDVSVADVVGSDTLTLQELTQQQRSLQLNNIWAATLAGDVAQTALHYEGRGGNNAPAVLGPGGFWNSTYCPHEYSLASRASVTAMTNAEIYGGIDGYLIGSQLKDWSHRSGFRLSSVLRMYYSADGVSYDRRFRACDRLTNLLNDDLIKQDTLQTEAVNFGYAYYAADLGRMPMLVQDSLDEAMTALVQKVIDQLMRFAGNSMTDDGPGCKAVPPAGDTNTDPICSTKADLMAVMDPSQGDSSLQAQKVFLSEMALAMDIGWNKSYVQVVSGVDGQVLLDKWNYTNKARLACDAQHISVPSGQLDLMQTLDALITYYGNLLDQERSDMTARSNTQVLLLMRASTRIDNEDDVAYKLNTLCDMFPDLNIFTLTDNPNVFSGVQQKMDRRQFLSDNMFTTESSQQGIRDTLVPKVNSQMCQTPSRFVYPACNTDNLGYTYNENNHEYTHFITPGRVAYLRLGPEQFFSSSDLKLQFESTFGSLQFCISREDPMPADGGDDVTCMSTESVSTSQVEFTFNAPCNEDQMNGDCPPFYISIQQNPASTGTDNVNLCSDDECPFPNSIRYTLKHENMRCNSVSSLAVPAFLLAAAALLRQVAQ